MYVEAFSLMSCKQNLIFFTTSPKNNLQPLNLSGSKDFANRFEKIQLLTYFYAGKWKTEN